MKIKLSKKQWLESGRKAGWTTAQMEVPVSKVPNTLTTMTPEIMMQKIKHQIEESIGDDSWSEGHTDWVAMQALIKEYPDYADYIRRMTGEQIGAILSTSADPGHEAEIIPLAELYAEAFESEPVVLQYIQKYLPKKAKTMKNTKVAQQPVVSPSPDSYLDRKNKNDQFNATNIQNNRETTQQNTQQNIQVVYKSLIEQRKNLESRLAQNPQDTRSQEALRDLEMRIKSVESQMSGDDINIDKVTDLNTTMNTQVQNSLWDTKMRNKFQSSIKITKNASGKQVLKMSKSDWLSIGKKAGWLKVAQGDMDDYADINQEMEAGEQGLNDEAPMLDADDDLPVGTQVVIRSGELHYRIGRPWNETPAVIKSTDGDISMVEWEINGKRYTKSVKNSELSPYDPEAEAAGPMHD